MEAGVPVINIASIQISKNQAVCIEDLLMKLALAEQVFTSSQNYVNRVEECNGRPEEELLPPDEWAVAGAFHSLMEVKHALKCICWGYTEAQNR